MPPDGYRSPSLAFNKTTVISHPPAAEPLGSLLARAGKGSARLHANTSNG
jgi:hypothetical protein